MSSALYVGPDSQPDKYRLVRSVGRGGEATLYLAEVTLAGQTEPVVVKVLNADVAATPEQFAELSGRWSEQAELLRFITRLGVVGVREHFEGAPEHREGTSGELADRALYLVMNYVEGVDLRDWRAEHAVDGPRGQRVALGYLEQVAEVLDVLHSGRATPSKRPVVHGDLSPGNVMINEDGQAILVDFGLSRIAARHLTARPWFTPGYAAPEIFNGEYSPAGDRYAFGAIVYFALSGIEPPPSPEQLRAAFGELPVMATAGPDQRERVMAMFSAEAAARPAALDWIKAVRSVSTSAPWSGPVSDPGTASTAAGSAPWSGPAEPTGGRPAEAPGGVLDQEARSAEAPVQPPAGPRVSGPPPQSRPAQPAQSASGGLPSGPGQGAPAGPPSGVPPQNTQFGGPGPQRPVGGLRGVPAPPPPPQPQQQHSGSMPTAPMPPVPPVPGPPSGPQQAWASTHEIGGGGRPVRKKSRKPLIIGTAVVVVLAMAGASVGTVYVMDWWERTNAAAVVPESSPGAEQAGEEQSAASQPGTSDPSPGAPASEAPVRPESDERYLATMDGVDSSYGGELERGNVNVNTETYTRALVDDLDCYSDQQWSEYNLDRSWTGFDSVVGLSDTSDADASITFSVIVDGEELYSETAKLGTELEVDVDVTGGLRMRLQVEPGADCEDADMTAVWGDPRLTK
ncbi:protein kinase domain-containing protein [Actinorugispora endophytica]|uniref:non-specific serine/threonine protein kinase n=1 Tax=Actinorugispora endophytica TaxID=1605990 RepID=A0A4R6V083_9ACTN|nr:NPCBM/NEW2 domain-containing protein [Actinorugispora endophytica]TDQ53310.1 NPCBM/NEW2 domain-containing protein [Actinorugispora endophytica]